MLRRLIKLILFLSLFLLQIIFLFYGNMETYGYLKPNSTIAIGTITSILTSILLTKIIFNFILKNKDKIKNPFKRDYENKSTKKIIAFEILVLIITTILFLTIYYSGEYYDNKEYNKIEVLKSEIDSLKDNPFRNRFNFLNDNNDFYMEPYTYDSYKKKVLNDTDTSFRSLIYRRMSYWDKKYENEVSFEEFIDRYKKFDSINLIDERIEILENRYNNYDNNKGEETSLLLNQIIILLLYPLRYLYYIIRWSIKTLKEK